MYQSILTLPLNNVHHFHDNGIHTKGQGSIDKYDFKKMINFIGRKNILDADLFLKI